MQVDSVLFAILSLGELLGCFLIAMNYEKKYTIAVTSAAVINVILNFVLIRSFNLGAIGAVIASIIAECVCTGRQLYSVEIFHGYRPIIKAAVRYILPTSFMAAGIILIQWLFSGVISLILSVVIGMIIYGTSLIIGKDEIAVHILKKARIKICNLF